MALLVGFQLWLAAGLALPSINLSKVSFRQEQRTAAYKAYSERRSPESKAAFEEEVRLALRYVNHRQLTKAAVLSMTFLAFDAAVVFLWRCRAKQKTACAPPLAIS